MIFKKINIPTNLLSKYLSRMLMVTLYIESLIMTRMFSHSKVLLFIPLNFNIGCEMIGMTEVV